MSTPDEPWMLDAKRKWAACRHEHLRFGSGGFYVMCSDCNATWVAKGFGPDTDIDHLRGGGTLGGNDTRVQGDTTNWKAKYENAMACIHAVRVSLDRDFANWPEAVASLIRSRDAWRAEQRPELLYDPEHRVRVRLGDLMALDDTPPGRFVNAMSETYQPEPEPETEPSEFEREEADEMEEAERRDEPGREHG